MPSAVIRIVSIAIRDAKFAKFPQANNNRVFKSYEVDS